MATVKITQSQLRKIIAEEMMRSSVYTHRTVLTEGNVIAFPGGANVDLPEDVDPDDKSRWWQIFKEVLAGAAYGVYMAGDVAAPIGKFFEWSSKKLNRGTWKYLYDQACDWINSSLSKFPRGAMFAKVLCKALSGIIGVGTGIVEGLGFVVGKALQAMNAEFLLELIASSDTWAGDKAKKKLAKLDAKDDKAFEMEMAKADAQIRKLRGESWKSDERRLLEAKLAIQLYESRLLAG